MYEGKQKLILHAPPPFLTDNLVKCPNYWLKKVLPAYCHFRETKVNLPPNI